MMTRLRHHVPQGYGIASAGLLLLLLHYPARSETLTTILSSDTVTIGSNFTGAEIVLFGTISRDSHTISRQGGYDVVNTLRGPIGNITMRRKEYRFGMWIHSPYIHLTGVPRYLGVFSNRSLDSITTAHNLHRYELGLDKEHFLGMALFRDSPEFAKIPVHLFRIMKKHGLYLENDHGVEFLNETTFVSRFLLPSHVPPGTYVLRTVLFGDGAALDSTTLEIQIGKGRLESLIAHAAMEWPFSYAVASVLLALCIGWLGSLIFRRD